MKKKIVTAAAIAVAVVMIALVTKNFIAKNAVTAGVRAVLGIPMKIDRLSVGVFRSAVRIQGLTVYNPEGFEGEKLAHIPLIYVDYELGSILKGKIHCTVVEVQVAEVGIVRNKEGEVNLNRLKAIASAGEEESAEKEPVKEALEMQIDKLILSVDDVVYKNYERKGESEEKRISLGLDHEEFENLTSVNQIVRVVVLRVVTKSGLHNIGVAVGTLARGLKNVGGKTGEVLKGLGKGVGKGLKTGVGKAGEGVRKLFGK